MAKQDFKGLIFLKFDKNAAVGKGNLRSTHPKKCVGTAQCGITFDVRLPSVKEATLSYKVKFDSGYHFSRGGKLPGLCSDDCPSGCTDMRNRGWSSRVMWRDNGAAMSYMYTADKPASTNCGSDWSWGKAVRPGKWHTVKMYVKINKAGKSNGVQKVWLDGKQVISKNNIKYLTNDKHTIEKFTFRNFHGGSDTSWSPKKNQNQYFDNIKVQEGQC